MFNTKGNSRTFNLSIKKHIREGQNDKIKPFIKGMAPSELVDSSKTSLLHLAARYNNHDLTRDLIKIKCNVNAKNTSQMSPLMVAVSNNSFKTAQILIEAKADIYARNSTKKSALNLLLNNKKVPQYLIKCCFEKLKTEDPSDKAIAKKLFIAKCPLHFVILLKNPNVTRQFINTNGQIDQQQLRVAMDQAIILEDEENVSVLLQFGVEIDISNSRAVQFLDKFCMKRPCNETNLQFINTFLEKVSDWNSLEENHLVWVDSIFRNGTKQQLDIFLEHNVNAYVKNNFPGHDLFINILGNHNIDAKDLLKNLEFDIHSRGEDGLTALHFAAEIQDLTLAKILLESGVNPNIKDIDGRVPLSLMNPRFYNYDDNSQNNVNELASIQIKIIDLLLQFGADPQLDMENRFGQLWHENFYPLKLQLMLAQLAIDASMGKPISEAILHEINITSKVKNIYEACCQEIEKLKNMKVYGSITLYSILVTDTTKLADSIRDQEALEVIANDIKQFNFYYVSKLKNSINQILHTMNLREKAFALICEITGWPNSQYIVLEKILSYLTYKDLLAFD